METIIAAVVSAVAAIIVCVITNRVQTVKTIAIMETKLDGLARMIDRLEQAQNKHNGVIDRVYHLEQDNAVQNERIAMLSDTVEELRK